MRITRVSIENFRSIRSLNINLGRTTVFVGPNNAGKSAILDAVRIVLTRRWGQRGTGFTESDVHRAEPNGDVRELPPIRITLVLEEPSLGEWDEDMVAALDEVMTLSADGRNVVTLQVTCAWDEDKEAFEPVWQFLDSAGDLLPERRRAINLTGFFGYMPLFWLGPLRDAGNEFTPRSGYWGGLLRSVHIPPELEEEAMTALGEIDTKIVEADARLSEIAEMIGQATRIAIDGTPGTARLNTMPLGVQEMLQRTGIVIRNEEAQPWLPLESHGQGLQSLAVIFLFQAAVLQQMSESERPGLEAVFAIEEPEAHLHPQAARTLWEHVQGLPGQRLLTTHSPYFLQHVPLHEMRVVRLSQGRTTVDSLRRQVVSTLPWNDAVGVLCAKHGKGTFEHATTSGRVVACKWFDEEMGRRLTQCYRKNQGIDAEAMVERLRYDARMLLSNEDETDLGMHGRRIRGEIFFAARWILVEGVTEHLLCHAIAAAVGFPLDTHGIAVVDFQNGGNPAVYVALAEALGIPWQAVVDGDSEGGKFKSQITRRGFREEDFAGKFFTLPEGNDLEDELLAGGHGPLLREILSESHGDGAMHWPNELLRTRLKKRKTRYMGALARRVVADEGLARTMPSAFVELIDGLRGGEA
ncbi:MAG: AAA family ATPase [Gammaproteobacteria bacterium]|nr:AAA family ATPase [Gammaproteobacteria bacterium]